MLIGPINAGKSTVAALLGEALGWPTVDVDQVARRYYLEIGYDPAEDARRAEQGGFLARYQYWKPFEIHALERVVAEHSDRPYVFDLGAGHVVYEEVAYFERARYVLAPFRHVVLLLPAADPEECIDTLVSRLDDSDPRRAQVVDSDVNRHLIEHHSFRDLATLTIYNGALTPPQTCSVILSATRGA